MGKITELNESMANLGKNPLVVVTQKKMKEMEMDKEDMEEIEAEMDDLDMDDMEDDEVEELKKKMYAAKSKDEMKKVMAKYKKKK